jgi:hypothetical protein
MNTDEWKDRLSRLEEENKSRREKLRQEADELKRMEDEEEKLKEEEQKLAKEQQKEEKKEEKREKKSEEKSKKRKHLDEIDLKLHPRIILKWLLLIVLFACFFFLGRLTVDCALEPLNGDLNTVESEPLELNADESTSKSLFSRILGMFSADEENLSLESELLENNTEGTNEEVEEPETTESEPEVIPAVEPEEEKEEAIVTTYNSVEVEVTDLTLDWKETWGKITRFKYSIKNGESGTIEPDHFEMLVEGYGDFEKEAPVSRGTSSVRSGTTVSSSAIVSGGFSYNEITAGDLTSVNVIFNLYDQNDKLIDTYTKAFNLNG